ncbi:MAG TPA: DegV family protein [Lachnospiraceae bacterium]|jgi:DegV family protein with EDD domain|nr:DegV family protein [Lachnospiraceae bacterium]
MADYVLSCCSTADLSDEYFKKRNIPYVCFHFELGGIDYLDDCGKSVTPEEMFKRMDAGEDTKTSQVSVGEYSAHFEQFLKEGKDVLHLTLSTGISGTYNAACIAANELKEKYPDRKLYIVDSLAASSGFGLLVDKLADMRDAGVGIDELHAWAEDNKLRLHHWFFSTDLTYYIRGGRVSKVAGFFGTALNICPLLNVDFQGRLIPREKIHGKKKVIKRIVEKMEEFAEDGTNYSGKCFISQSACMDDAREVADLIEANFPKLSGKVEIFPIGATIGSHTGPGTVALFFWGKKRED